MGNRLSKIYTKTGDKGTTAVSDGVRILKSHPRIQSLGQLDHLNAHIGQLRCEDLPGQIESQLDRIQHRLFDIGGELSMPELVSIKEQDIRLLETEIDTMNESLPALKEFILPGGSQAAALCHVARTQCRIAEIHCLELSQALKDNLDKNNDGHEGSGIRQEILAYLNRLSDWLFVAARFILHWQKSPEVVWQKSF